MERKSLRVSVIIISEGGAYTAQCLQYDIAAQGETISKVKDRFARTFSAHIAIDRERGIEPLSGIPESPQEYWELWNSAHPLLGTLPIRVPSLPPGIQPPPAWMIEAMGEEIRIL